MSTAFSTSYILLCSTSYKKDFVINHPLTEPVSHQALHVPSVTDILIFVLIQTNSNVPQCNTEQENKYEMAM